MNKRIDKFAWLAEFAACLRNLRPGLSPHDRMPERIAAQEWIACRDMEAEDAATAWHEAHPPTVDG